MTLKTNKDSRLLASTASVVLVAAMLSAALPSTAMAAATAPAAKTAQTAPLTAATIPQLEAARKLPAADRLKLATQTLIGQPRMLDYGFGLLLPSALAGDRASIQLLAKAISTNEYGFGDKTNAVLNALANEAMRGSSTSIVAWALIHDRGIDTDRDEAKAYEWFRWAAVAGSDSGAQLTALDLAQGKGVAMDKVEAVTWADRIKVPAKRAEAYLALAKIFVRDDPKFRDLPLAQRLALQSATVDPAGAFDAGVLLIKHSTDPSTLAQAKQLIDDAAGRKDPKAQLYLAGSPQSSTQQQSSATAPLYDKLAAMGDDQAMLSLAKTLSRIDAKPEELAHTIDVLKTGAANGSVAAMMSLSNAYFYGVGASVSFESAAQYYRQAADAGNTEAQYQLGLMYANAIGMPADQVQARFWLQKAANAGYSLASLSLASLQSAQ